MFNFPQNLYTDLRIEDVFQTNITFENGEMKQNKIRKTKGAFIRIFDGVRWYYLATTNLSNLQEEIDHLSEMATPNEDIYNHPVIQHLEVNQDVCLTYVGNSVAAIAKEDKVALLTSYLPILDEHEELKVKRGYYLDNYTKKQFISSKGCDVTFDYQHCAIVLAYELQVNKKNFYGSKDFNKTDFSLLRDKSEEFYEEIKKDIAYITNAVPVKAGIYPCVLSPLTTGVFAHESFGHKSEADFMIGDETMKREWAIGTSVGTSNLNIIDDGAEFGSGFVPYDDEGCKAKKTYLIKDGILSGRLHSATTAAALTESPTGNARAKDFEFEPIVRMTTTYIEAGDSTKEDLISSVAEGIYIENIKHGSGMSTFTIAPRRAYMIRNGKIAEPVEVAVITGNVMETLNKIKGFSAEVELHAFTRGGCGKLEQFPLRVGFGGPYILVNDINVQ